MGSPRGGARGAMPPPPKNGLGGASNAFGPPPHFWENSVMKHNLCTVFFFETLEMHACHYMHALHT